MNRRLHPVTLQQAANESPTLARLAALSKDSCARLKAIETMIPATLYPSIKAGPVDGSVWCLLIDSNAAAAKLRQLLPALVAHLQNGGWEITLIRIKVQVAQH